MGRLMHRFGSTIHDISSEVTGNRNYCTKRESSSALQLKNRPRKLGLLTKKLYREVRNM